MLIAKELRKALGFKEDEHVEFGIETKNPGRCETCGYEGIAAPDESCPRSIPQKDGDIPECSESKFVKSGQQHFYWNVEAERDAEIDINAKGSGVIVDVLNNLNKNGSVTEQHISLFEKFIGD